jgi:hypothetical protein
MKTLAKRIKEAFAVVLLITACVVSAGQLSASAQSVIIDPGGGGCAGLGCVDKSDCGSACFCNRPSQTCYKDGE